MGRTEFIFLKPGEINLNTDIGIKNNSSVICFFTPGGIGSSGATSSPVGRVWTDINGDGFLSRSEPGMSSIKVELIETKNNSILQTVFTDSDGNYVFDRIDPKVAKCYLQITQPRGYMLTKNVSGSCYPTNDFDQKTRKTVEFTTSACPYYSSYDAGLIKGTSILGRGN